MHRADIENRLCTIALFQVKDATVLARLARHPYGTKCCIVRMMSPTSILLRSPLHSKLNATVFGRRVIASRACPYNCFNIAPLSLIPKCTSARRKIEFTTRDFERVSPFCGVCKGADPFCRSREANIRADPAMECGSNPIAPQNTQSLRGHFL